MRREAQETKTPPVCDWEPWCCAKPGHFWCYETEIDRIRGEFLAQRRHPRVTLKDEARIKALRYTFTKADADHRGTCVLHALPQDWQEIQRWVTALDCGLIYRGEGLPAMTYKALLRLITRKERVYLTGPEKNELLEKHGYACALCGAKENNLEWDHVAALSTSWSEQEFEPLCAQCHTQKTADEPRNFDQDPLASHFCPSVWEAYVESPRPPPLIHKPQEFGSLDGLFIADVRRCRKSALEFCIHEVPVFSPLDDVEVLDDHIRAAHKDEHVGALGKVLIPDTARAIRGAAARD